MEPVKENKPYIGMFCRGIYKQDGLEYEGIVKSIASTDDGEYAVVEFIGYGNEEPIWFQDLIESKGEEARDKQRKEALEEESPTVINEDTKEQGEGSYKSLQTIPNRFHELPDELHLGLA